MMPGAPAKAAATDLAVRTQVHSSDQRGRRRHSAMIVPRVFGVRKARAQSALIVPPATSTAHFSMAGARLALTIRQRVVRQFDRNVIFSRNRLATFAAFGRRRQRLRLLQSSLSPIARITLDRVSAWARTKAANSCGELEKAGSMPA